MELPTPLPIGMHADIWFEGDDPDSLQPVYLAFIEPSYGKDGEMFAVLSMSDLEELFVSIDKKLNSYTHESRTWFIDLNEPYEFIY